MPLAYALQRTTMKVPNATARPPYSADRSQEESHRRCSGRAPAGGRILAGATERGLWIRADLSQPGRAWDPKSDCGPRGDNRRRAEGAVSGIGWPDGDVGRGARSPVNRPVGANRYYLSSGDG